MRVRIFSAVIFCALAVTFLSFPVVPHAESSEWDGRPDQAVLQPQAELRLAAAANEYLSPPTEAARPFSHLMIRREAEVPEGAFVRLFVRASVDGTNWSNWGEAQENDDLWDESDGPDVWWSESVEVGAIARFWQVRAEFLPAPGGALPELRRIEVNTVDVVSNAPANPTATQEPQLNSATTAVSKPAVVSRTAWGSPDGQGSRARPAYYAVRHIVIHHTADSNSLYPGQTNWAARVRAIWSFHAISRGWGDIGYNYLIDPNGVIYEGRAGGDDAVGFHDTANYGSMGVSVMGTYTSVRPTAASQNSLVTLMAWKAAQKRFDPLGSSYYYGCAISRYCNPFNPGAVVPHIAGHRQVTPGHTACPGDAFMALMPNLRNQVKQLIDRGGGSVPPPNNGEIQVDELEGGFARSNAQWYSAACGVGGHTFYTYATDTAAQSTNSATWRPTIPADGSYRVYAHIPQGCGLASPPYASTRAAYRVRHASGTTERVIDQNTTTAWVDLGVYSFRRGTDGAVELYDLTGEPFSQRRVLFFDAIKWVPESARTEAQLVNVRYDRTTVASGELLKVTFTIRNTGNTTLATQSPQAATAPDTRFNDGSSGRADDSYVYDEGECFGGNAAQSYAAFRRETNRFRVTLGPTDMSGIQCVEDAGGYPWRWGLNGDLLPGQTRDIIGYVRLRNEGTSNRTLNLRAGLVQEYVRYFAENAAATTITVTPERIRPEAAAHDALLHPVAQVYQLGRIPDNFLARTANALSIPRGEYVGSFPWNGAFIDWGQGGPLGQSDRFIVDQTRAFVAPVSGEYTFRTMSDDGSWLWVNGQPVVLNHGLHPIREATGRIRLDAGVHVLAFRYFELGGDAAAGYAMQLPGGTGFIVPPNPNESTLRLGNTFVEAPDLVITADDLGGSGVARIRWSWDGTNWQETAGGLLRTGRLQNGSYRLRYQAIDRVGNQGDMQELAFNVNTSISVQRTYLPATMR